MTLLYVLLGIVAFFVIAFSFRVTFVIDYSEHTKISVKYLFLNIPIVDSSAPPKEKKPKKEKKKKDKKEEGSAEAGSTAEPKEKKKKEKPQGNGFLKQLYIDEGYDGIVKMLSAVKKSLGGFLGRLYKNLTIDEMYITMVTVGNDAADTALKHGRLCAWAYPVLGKIVSTCKVKKYDVDFSPDFLGVKSTAEAYVKLHLTPIRLTNSVVILALELVFKVLFKLLFVKKNSDKSKVNIAVEETKMVTATDENKNNLNENKDGASK